ncbi:hypothetical protein [uncultured Psychroserpens sp.]|uniref:hypothetical protein n=1 Tax=uncultured Psychroserpens sp. TaxID=255436 RepID=UPI0026356AE0|nr:hypothetical protein [uncultured Psychroserpens sp.]
MKKLKAGSLQLVTFIVVVIALLLSAFIMLIHIHKKFRLRTDHIIETVGLINYGMNQSLDTNLKYEDTITIDLNTEDYKSLKVHKSFWGVYEKVHTVATIKNYKLKKTALVGSIQHQTEKSTLVLKDNNKPLVLVGQTKINGDAFLPERGVKSGNIAGISYYGKRYIYGKTYESKGLPKIEEPLLSYISTLEHYNRFKTTNQDYLNLDVSKQHINTFKNSEKRIYSINDLYLSNIEITGHISIHSETKIIIEKSAKLTDVILIAPIIEIRDHVIGTFQAFATKQINVAKHVALDYPSALVLKKNITENNKKDTSAIFIDDFSTIKGHIISLGKTFSNNYEPQIIINPSVLIKGIIYCEQNLELRGTVIGSVYTNNFIIKEAGSIYQNHLYNAKISNEELEPQFVAVPIVYSKKNIAKWLY